jgi:NADPH:quinone reductase-like Zn-dependent oxidoreductase
MKAIVLSKYGSFDSLELRELDVPKPRADEVLIRIHATSINDWDVALVAGRPVYVRLIHGWRRPNVAIPGCDVAGVVESVGKSVTRFRSGDPVYGDIHGTGFGAYAEFACTRENALEPMPSSLSFEQAAVIPHGATLAWQALFDVAKLQPRERLLINGAGGGVGPIALQLAKLHDAEVTGVDSGEKLPMLSALGFDHVLDYTQQDFTRSGEEYDLVLDVRTTRSPFAYARALRAGGRYVTVGGTPAALLQMALLGRWAGRRQGKSMKLLGLKANRGLKEMAELLETERIVPVVDRTYPLAEVPEAMRRFASGQQRGRIAITCGDPIH